MTNGRLQNSIFKVRIIALLVMMIFVLSYGIPGVNAATILSNPSQFTGPTTLIDFEQFPGGAAVPYISGDLDNEWMSLGVIISDSSPATGVSAYSSTFGNSPHSGIRALADSENVAGGFIQYSFVIPNTFTPGTVLEAGIWVQNGDGASEVAFYNGNGLFIDAITTSGSDFFAGLRSAEGIGSITVSDDGYYLTDDLEFSTTIAPEPISSTLFIAGGATLGFRRFRKRRKV